MLSDWHRVSTVLLWSLLRLSMLCGSLDANDELVIVNVLYRHGARSPAVTYPTDPNNSKWPDGLGRLTKKGMNLEYSLGKFLRGRYVDTKFINTSYLHKEVHIRSSGVDRCLQSAETQLAGLYPPSGRQVWNEKLLWQPIPVQTVPTDEDPLLRPESTDCPRYKQLIKEMQQQDEYVQKEKDSKELLDYMTAHAGVKITFNKVWHVSDPTISELTEGSPMSPPSWVLIRANEILDLGHWTFKYSYHGTPELGRLTGGTLLGEMQNNMREFIAGKKTEKLNMYSAHDSTLYSLSAALNIQITEIPFAACVVIELFKSSSGAYYVQMNYRNDTNSSRTVPWKLNDCPYNCPLEQFISLTKDRIPTDRQTECQISSKFTDYILSYQRLKVIAVIFVVLTLFLTFLVVWLCAKKHSTKQTSYRGGLNDNDEDVSLIEKPVTNA